MPHRLATRVILLLCFLCPLPVAAQDSPAVDSVATLYRKARAAAIEVLVNDHLNGSGVLVDKSGLAITAAHVVGRPGSRVEVLTADVVRRKAEVVAVDLGHDTAVLKVELGQQVMAAAPLAAQLPIPGEELYLLGAPVYRHGVMLRGAMAREGATFEYCGEHYVAVIQIAATAQPGTSGGAWFNRRGEVVSLQSSVMSSNGVPIGIAFGTLASAARALLETQRTAATPTLGAALEETWQQQREFLDRFPPRTEGLVVKVLRGDGPAARAGLKQWDVIVQADGKPVRQPDELMRIVVSKKPGDVVPLTVLGPDGTGVRKTTVQLGKLEVNWPEKK
jgi:S1-C subfamily serine protease